MSQDPFPHDRSGALTLLVARAQSGNLDALDALLRERQGPLHRHIKGITGDADLAFDVLQDVLLLVARRLSTLRDARLFRAWSYRIATREAVRQSRRERGLQSVSEDEAAAHEVIGTSHDLPDHRSRDEIEAELESLPAASQTVLRMHYLDEMTFVEIGEALELPIGTVKSRTAYGLALLRRRLAS